MFLKDISILTCSKIINKWTNVQWNNKNASTLRFFFIFYLHKNVCKLYTDEISLKLKWIALLCISSSLFTHKDCFFARVSGNLDKSGTKVMPLPHLFLQAKCVICLIFHLHSLRCLQVTKPVCVHSCTFQALRYDILKLCTARAHSGVLDVHTYYKTAQYSILCTMRLSCLDYCSMFSIHDVFLSVLTYLSICTKYVCFCVWRDESSWSLFCWSWYCRLT